MKRKQLIEFREYLEGFYSGTAERSPSTNLEARKWVNEQGREVGDDDLKFEHSIMLAYTKRQQRKARLWMLLFMDLLIISEK